jgi:dTDP-glucose 4,6-dehydratase
VYNIGGDNEKENMDIVRFIQEKLHFKNELIKLVEDRPGHDFMIWY